MIGAVLLIIFFSGLVFFGWQIGRFVFKISQIELLLPVSLSVGYGAYTFFLNIFSYLIPIRLNFYLVFVFLLIIGFILFFLNKERPSLIYEVTKKEGLIIFGVVFIVMVLSGLIASRNIEADDLAGPHLPLASLITGGSFPVKNPNIPNYDLAVHYGPSLFYAAISRITGFSIFFALSFSAFLFSGVILLLIFSIAKLFIKNNIGSFFVGLVGFFGGGFRFIYGFDGLITLYKKFILHYNIEHPFSFLGDIWKIGPLAGSFVGSMFNTWSALGWSSVLLVIYLYLKIIIDKKWSYYYDFLMIILLSVLALNVEMGFLSISIGMVLIPFIFYFKDKNKDNFKALLKHSLLILIITSILVLFQGGTVTGILKNTLQERTSYGVGLDFSIFKTPLSFDTGKGVIPFYSSLFIISFGLIYFLIIPALIFIIKKYFREGMFLIVISCFSFLVPLFVSFSWVWQGTLDRFFRFSSFIWAILIGLFLVIILQQFKFNDLSKSIIYLFLIIICLEGVLFLLTRPLYKKAEYRLDNNSFFTKLRPLTKAESDAYNWVKKNSNIKDYFLVFGDKNDINNQATIFENFRFVIFAQRMAPIYTQSNNYINATLPIDEYHTPIYKRLISDCSREDMKILNYGYLFVDNNWPFGLEEKCLANNDLRLKFQEKEGNNFVRIYKVL